MEAFNFPPGLLQAAIYQDVGRALQEDLGAEDITAALIPADRHARARILTREPAIVAGRPWVEACFHAVSSEVRLNWKTADGAEVKADQTLFEAEGPARALLTAERCALNFLQTLSATATRTRAMVRLVEHTECRILDTRKTLPGLRIAQKYAVRCGGGQNHRLGLWDAFLIKENHIMACGGIGEAIEQARRTAPGKPVEIEIENLSQLEPAIGAGADIIMLDNFSLEQMRDAVARNRGRVKLEASGNVNESTLPQIAETGVDFVSIGGLTKHCQAIDLSMRLVD